MRVLVRRFLWISVVLLLGMACGNETARTPSTAQQSYGVSVDASDARPGPAIAAEHDRYVGRYITVDGRITSVSDDGCQVKLDTNTAPPLRIEAPRSAGDCAWTVPPGTNGIAAATGTLRVSDDALRLSANGVQVTPVRIQEADL
jgi:hypothetical protein